MSMMFLSKNKNDEILNYELPRYISTNEAIWRIFNFNIHEHFPSIVRLNIYLKDH